MIDAELRRRNRAVVEDYLGRHGVSRLTRYLLFTEDGSAGLYTADTVDPIVSRGHGELRARGEWASRMFPDWRWFDITVFETRDPNWIWAECKGEGSIHCPGYPPGLYRNHFLHSFQFEEGRITIQREFMSPFQQLRVPGVGVPGVDVPGGGVQGSDMPGVDMPGGGVQAVRRGGIPA